MSSNPIHKEYAWKWFHDLLQLCDKEHTMDERRLKILATKMYKMAYDVTGDDKKVHESFTDEDGDSSALAGILFMFMQPQKVLSDFIEWGIREYRIGKSERELMKAAFMRGIDAIVRIMHGSKQAIETIGDTERR